MNFVSMEPISYARIFLRKYCGVPLTVPVELKSMCLEDLVSTRREGGAWEVPVPQLFLIGALLPWHSME